MELRLAYQNALQTYKHQAQALEQLKEQQSQLLKEKDYLSFLLNEFEALSLKADEELSIEQSFSHTSKFRNPYGLFTRYS